MLLESWNSTAYYNDGVDLTEPSLEMFVGLSVTVLALVIASAGGIGGGGILVPLFILLLHWSPRYAIPLSNITILGGAIMNTAVNISKRHPEANRPLIDWDLVLIMEPLTILGALFGSFLNRLLPEFILILMLAIVLAATAKRTMKKGLTLWFKESEQNRLKGLDGQYLPVAKDEDGSENGPNNITDEEVATEGDMLGVMALYEPVGTIASDSILPGYVPLVSAELLEKGESVLCQRSNGEWCHSRVHSYYPNPPTLTLQVDQQRRKVLDLTKQRHLGRVRVVPQGSVTRASKARKDKKGDVVRKTRKMLTEVETEELAAVLEGESKHSKSKICVLFIAFSGVLFFDIAKEYSKCGSNAYWASALLTIPWTLVFFFGYRNYLIKMEKRKQKLGFEFMEGDVHWDSRSTTVYPVLCIFAGFFAGLFGVGGGIIKGPLMLEMGIQPTVASANAATMILFTAGTAALSFILFGAVDSEVGVILFVVGIISTGVGQFFLGIAIKRANRQSLVVLSMGSVVVLSAFLLTMRSIVSAATSEGGVSTLVTFGQLCTSDEVVGRTHFDTDVHQLVSQDDVQH